MKLDVKTIKRLDKDLLEEACALIEKVREIDSREAYGTGYAQSGVIAKIMAKMYNETPNVEDKMTVSYGKKD